MQFLESGLESSFLSRTPLTAFLVIFIWLFTIYLRFSRNGNHDGLESASNPTSESKPKTKTDTGASSYPPITPLPTFDWTTTEPLIFRPFKPKYHLTMATSTLNPSELIPMDMTYLSRLSLRKQLLAKHPDVVRAVNIQQHDPQKNDEIREALCEWYAFVMGVYLPQRYPEMFRLLPPTTTTTTTMIESIVTGLKVPVDPEELMRSFSKCSSKSGTGTGSTDDNANNNNNEDGRSKEELAYLHLLDTLGTWIDEDFLILLPSPSSTSSDSDPDPKYHLQAYATYYPAGFNPRTKLSHPLSEIHSPVPGFKQKLEKSMDRFFARLEVGRVVVRVNWSIMTPGTGLFAAFGGLHGDSHSSSSTDDTSAAGESGGEAKGGEGVKVEGFSMEETYLRCERQTLHRLAKSKALVFAVHTYTYPIKDVKDEGLGEEFAVAIDGLKGGSVPGIYPYKRGPYWGEAVKVFLRS